MLVVTLCEHTWETNSDKILPAPIKTLMSSVQSIKRLGDDDLLTLSQQTHILIMVCTKCGKVYKSVTKG